MSGEEYTPSEMMIVAASRALAGARTVFVGVGLPNVVCNLAILTVAPELQLIYESGVYGARPARQPLSIGDPALVSGATAVVSMADLFGSYLQGGLVDVALLGGAHFLTNFLPFGTTGDLFSSGTIAVISAVVGIEVTGGFVQLLQVYLREIVEAQLEKH